MPNQSKILSDKISKLTPAVDFSDTVVISHSQVSNFNTCQRRWYLKHVLKAEKDNPSIHTIFGTAMHEVIQEMLEVLYTRTIKDFNEYDYVLELKNKMRDAFLTSREKFGDTIINFVTQSNMEEFYLDGVEILKYLVKKRSLYFDKKNLELVAIELPLFYPIKKFSNGKRLVFLAYLDLTFKYKNENRYLIVDIKTSSTGWNAYKKADKTTVSQVLEYKHFFAKQYNIPIDSVDVKFFILRRKLPQDNQYHIKRIQEFIPGSGPRLMKAALENVEKMNIVFDEEGNYKKDFIPLALAGENSNNCRFCIFKDNDELCPFSERIK